MGILWPSARVTLELACKQYTRSNVGPLIVSGEFGKASMVLPFLKWICVLWGLNVRFGGSLCANVAMRWSMRFVWRHDGPTMAVAVFEWVVAYQSSSAEITKVFPLCLHQRAAVNWFSLNVFMNSS